MTQTEAEKLAAYMNKSGGNHVPGRDWLRTSFPDRRWDFTGIAGIIARPPDSEEPPPKPATAIDDGGLLADISVRMWLAGQALNGSLSNSVLLEKTARDTTIKTKDDEANHARMALDYADALIAESGQREKHKP